MDHRFDARRSSDELDPTLYDAAREYAEELREGRDHLADDELDAMEADRCAFCQQRVEDDDQDGHKRDGVSFHGECLARRVA